MTTLAEFMIIASAGNRPPMLEKSMYDSWKSRMELYMENRENGRMILNSVPNGPLVWPTIVQEDGTTRTKKYEELSVTEKLQADSDLKATNIVLQGLPPDVWLFLCLLKEMIQFPVSTRPLFKTAGLLCNKFKGGKDKVMLVLAIRVMPLVPRETIQEGRQGLLNAIIVKVKDTWLGNVLSLRGQGTLHDLGIPNGQGAQTTIPNNAAFQTEDLDAYDSDCDYVSHAKAVLMANLSNYDYDVISEVFQIVL
ncbi:hypothetical protein Tco_0237114 [Tanacetum coccineum]